MHKHLLSLIATGSLLAAPAFAGQPQPYPQQSYSKVHVEPAPEELYAPFGTRFYGALQGGINVEHEQGDIGGYGGLKAGYVFGTGTIRPAVEADLFYNYVRVGTEGGVTESSAKMHSGALIANFLVRFSMGNGQFQPYVGAGVGGYYGQVDGIEVSLGDADFEADEDSVGFAWQLIAGADYYFTERMSIFAEYKFLNYEDVSAPFVDDRLAQHLIGLGLRVHF